MISLVTIMHHIIDIRVDGNDPIYDILGDTKGPYFLYHN